MECKRKRTSIGLWVTLSLIGLLVAYPMLLYPAWEVFRHSLRDPKPTFTLAIDFAFYPLENAVASGPEFLAEPYIFYARLWDAQTAATLCNLRAIAHSSF
jgi:hypothetical protein